MFTIHSPVNNSTSESYLSFHFPFQIIDVWRVRRMPTVLVHQKHTLETLLYCVSIFQLISSLPTYPRTTVNLTYTYHFLFHSRFVVYCRTYAYVTVSFVNQPIVLFSCVSIFQLISSLHTYPPTSVN